MGNEQARELTDRYVAAQLAGDRRAALRVVLEDGLARGLTVPQLELHVIQPAQHRIGRLWEENRISIAQEHLATAISQLALAHLYPYLPRASRNGRDVVVACVEGELHDMGARVAADLLEAEGYDVCFLGASVPADSLVSLVRDRAPHLVALSATMAHHLPALRHTVQRLCDVMGADFPVAVGGGAMAAGGVSGVQGRVLACGDVQALIDGAPRLFAAGGGA